MNPTALKNITVDDLDHDTTRRAVACACYRDMDLTRHLPTPVLRRLAADTERDPIAHAVFARGLRLRAERGDLD